MEYRLLAELSANAGRLLTYEHLLERVWGEKSSGDVRPMRTIVSKLRRKLGDDADNPTYIFTEPRVGYRMPKGEVAERVKPQWRDAPYVPPSPTRHTTGIERPRCVDRLPSHISKMVVSTVRGGGPKRAVLRTRTKGRNGLCQKPCAAFLGQLPRLDMRQPVTPITMGMRVSMTAQNCPSASLLGDRELNQFQKNRMNTATAP